MFFPHFSWISTFQNVVSCGVMVSCGRLGVAKSRRRWRQQRLGATGFRRRNVDSPEPRPTSHWSSFARTSKKNVNKNAISQTVNNMDLLVVFFNFCTFWFLPNIFHVFHVLCSHLASSAVPSSLILTQLGSFSESMFFSVCDSFFSFNPRWGYLSRRSRKAQVAQQKRQTCRIVMLF